MADCPVLLPSEKYILDSIQGHYALPRFRLSLDDALHPGRIFQAIITLPDNLCTVLDLTVYLASRFRILSHPHGKGPEALQLFVDGFAVPSSERIRDVLREGDTISVREFSWESSAILECRLPCKRKVPPCDDQPCKRRLPANVDLVPGVALYGTTRPPSNLSADRIPIIDPWGSDVGRLVDALSICGAAFLKAPRNKLPSPDFDSWRELCLEATQRGTDYRQRPAVRGKLLKFQQGEDLSRTLEGADKEYKPDVRFNFGILPGSVLCGKNDKDWGDLDWIRRNFKRLMSVLKDLAQRELGILLSSGQPTEQEPKGTLGSKIVHYTENWGSSRFRHSVYPSGGSCTEHTDYGLVTLQQSTSAGLQARIDGSWHALHPPEGYALIFAGDMLERLTNGTVKALKHRVCLEHAEEPAGCCPSAVRQAHIVFLQPDKNTVVQPLHQYLRGDGTDLPAVRYMDWHSQKTSLAFHNYAFSS